MSRLNYWTRLQIVLLSLIIAGIAMMGIGAKINANWSDTQVLTYNQGLAQSLSSAPEALDSYTTSLQQFDLVKDENGTTTNPGPSFEAAARAYNDAAFMLANNQQFQPAVEAYWSCIVVAEDALGPLAERTADEGTHRLELIAAYCRYNYELLLAQDPQAQPGQPGQPGNPNGDEPSDVEPAPATEPNAGPGSNSGGGEGL